MCMLFQLKTIKTLPLMTSKTKDESSLINIVIVT